MSCVETMTLKYDSQEYISVLLRGLANLSGIKKEPYNKNFANNEVIPALYGLVKEAEEHGKDVIKNFNTVLNKPGQDKKQSFYTVVDSLFEDTIKWSRVIVAFMYIIEVLKIVDSDYSLYFDWSVELICERIEPWVEKNGGWEKIVYISQNRNSTDELTDTMKQIGKVVLGITGLFALGKWLFN